MEENLVITLAGGSRGLGREILERFSEGNFKKCAFHKSKNIENALNYYIDLEIKDVVEKTKEHINDIFKESSYKHYSFHFLSGGGLKIDFEDSSYLSFERVLFHNLIFPSCISSFLFNYAENNPEILIDLFYYSSSVIEHYRASPYYVAAKSGLEGLFKSSFLKRPKNLKMFLLRMGFVDIEHKYFHKLSTENPDEFTKILKNNVPSLHFTTPKEIANFAFDLYLKGVMMNGCICDISGGNSWN